MKISVKKALFVFCAAVALSAGLGKAAYAFPGYDYCYDMRSACVFDGNEEACEIVAEQCKRWVFPF